MSLWKNIRGQAGDEEPERAEARAAPIPLPAPPRIQREEGEPAEMANIGKSISIKGDVTGDEDTVIEGTVEGHIELKNHHLTVGPNGDVKGEISAKQVTIVGRVRGNVTANERIELSDSGRVEGDLVAPRLLVQEGAQLNGNVSMKSAAAPATTQPASSQPSPSPAATQPAKKLEQLPHQQKAG